MLILFNGTVDLLLSSGALYHIYFYFCNTRETTNEKHFATRLLQVELEALWWNIVFLILFFLCFSSIVKIELCHPHQAHHICLKTAVGLSASCWLIEFYSSLLSIVHCVGCVGVIVGLMPSLFHCDYVWLTLLLSVGCSVWLMSKLLLILEKTNRLETHFFIKVND